MREILIQIPCQQNVHKSKKTYQFKRCRTDRVVHFSRLILFQCVSSAEEAVATHACVPADGQKHRAVSHDPGGRQHDHDDVLLSMDVHVYENPHLCHAEVQFQEKWL